MYSSFIPTFVFLVQIKSAVAEMEKALDTPSNVMIYKQHWDYYARTPGLLDKLKTDQPVQHHLLQHFRQNFWHLVENLETLLVFQDVQTATVEVHSLLLLDSGRGQGKLCPALLLGNAGAAAQAEGSGGGQRPCRTPAAAQIESQAGGEIQTSSHRDNESVSGD